MSTPNPLEAESRATHARAAETRAKFAEHVAKVSTPQPAPQREPNAQAAAAAKAMQVAKNPDGSRKHTPGEIQAAWQRAYETPVSAGPNAQPATSYVSGNPGPGMVLVVGHDGVVKSVPDPNAKRAVAEPDAFGSQTAAVIAELGPARAAQNAKLNAFIAAVNPATGERYAKEDPRFLANVEAARAKLFAGEDLADTIAATEARLAESKFAQSVRTEGYTVTAPDGYELDASQIAKYAKIAKQNGIDGEAFQELVTAYVLENAE